LATGWRLTGWRRAGAIALGLGLFGPAAQAFDPIRFTVAGKDDSLTKAVTQSSVLLSKEGEGFTDAQDLFAAARTDYGRLLEALYAQGHYSGVIRILIDGREAADIAPLDAPSQISLIEVFVDPGPRFVFGAVEVAPLAPGSKLPKGFAPGDTAESGLVAEAVSAGTNGWRALGHAKTTVSARTITADHAARTLSADIRLSPGPKLRFGAMSVTGQERMRENRVRKIAGLVYGEVYSPLELDRAAARLRRSGIFSSVTFTEAEEITPPDTLAISLAVVEQKLRRYSVGAEIASTDGASLSGYWLHRNLLGGGERLRIEGAITNIGAKTSGTDYSLGVTLDRPATFSRDTTAGLRLSIEHQDEEDYDQDIAEIGLGFTHYFSEQLTARAAIEYGAAKGNDPAGSFSTRNLALPLGATWDSRDVKTDPTRGFYADAEIKPFLGFSTTGSGVRATFDGRAYRALGERLVIAGRVTAGVVAGSALLGTPREDLFLSGGGGSVRGQPYRSLGVRVQRGAGAAFEMGGRYQLGGSLELRGRVTDNIGIVGFFDIGSIGVNGFNDDIGGWHAGAGLGLRYATSVGPIRLDVALPAGGSRGASGSGAQVYIGLGQAF